MQSVLLLPSSPVARDLLAVGIDIGSSKIRTIVATLSGERSAIPTIAGVGIAPSHGVRKGAVVDVAETVSSIAAALEEAERMCGSPIHHAFVSAGGAHLMAFESRGVVAVGPTAVPVGRLHPAERAAAARDRSPITRPARLALPIRAAVVVAEPLRATVARAAPAL